MSSRKPSESPPSSNRDVWSSMPEWVWSHQSSLKSHLEILVSASCPRGMILAVGPEVADRLRSMPDVHVLNVELSSNSTAHSETNTDRDDASSTVPSNVIARTPVPGQLTPPEQDGEPKLECQSDPFVRRLFAKFRPGR
jgi:hypothetical protein